jgi:hypothetical protein
MGSIALFVISRLPKMQNRTCDSRLSAGQGKFAGPLIHDYAGSTVFVSPRADSVSAGAKTGFAVLIAAAIFRVPGWMQVFLWELTIGNGTRGVKVGLHCLKIAADQYYCF